MTTSLHQIAQQYLADGICALPADRACKMPKGKWKQFQDSTPVKWRWVKSADAICMVTGEVSGNMEVIDFDFEAELYEPWAELVERTLPDLLARLVIEQSQTGGKHVFYRCPDAVIEGNQDLAQRRIIRPSDEEFVYRRKTVTPKKGRVDITLIETRGEGGIILTAPSPGYQLIQGDFGSIPIIAPEEREALLKAARALHEIREEVKKKPPVSKPSGAAQGDRPGDDYNARGDFRSLLEAEGWEPLFTAADGNEHWKRPGKKFGTSATLKDKQFYVFSGNAGPFKAKENYSPFAIYTALKHDGDFQAATIALAEQGFGKPAQKRSWDEGEHNPQNDQFAEAQLVPEVDLASIMAAGIPAGETETVTIHAPPQPEIYKPAPRPDAGIYSIPGFIDSVIDHSLRTAPYPSQQLAFCGALSLLSVLVARKLRGPSGLLTNIMLLALANSGSGKDHPRQINSRVLTQAGMADRLIGRMASGQGLEDAVMASGSLLAQIDEFDSTLIAINKGDPIGAEIAARLMELYSSSQSNYLGRVKANEPRRSIANPHVSLFATCVPQTFYANLTEKLLSNGLVARTIVVETGERGHGQQVRFTALPESIIDAAEFWRDFRKNSTGLLEVDYSGEAQEVFDHELRRAEDDYSRCQKNNDNAGCSIWARTIEQAHKLAVLYAASEDRKTLQVSEEAALWSTMFTRKQAEWLLSQVAERTGEESKFEKIASRILQRVKTRGGRTTRSDALKASKVGVREFDEAKLTLQQSGQLSILTEERTEWLIAK